MLGRNQHTIQAEPLIAEFIMPPASDTPSPLLRTLNGIIISDPQTEEEAAHAPPMAPDGAAGGQHQDNSGNQTEVGPGTQAAENTLESPLPEQDT
ncbi:hypothetical protein BN14_07355 [Rhizoctonia solani AG-1 IB]|uniref:Uncharacterized protein n=1 Tax=Thanatephorus cucumeris (strain AG1-IB / isolate 7/3/14) TaxID=1108050 RepID=M5C1E4_THACB|nr:hypothetical protein BN14_07355 [Rhizoctonia solani AG-1 IB]